MSDLLKTGGRNKKEPFVWTAEAAEAFRNLKAAFTTASILKHFDVDLRILVETNASGFAVAGILSQLFGKPSFHQED